MAEGGKNLDAMYLDNIRYKTNFAIWFDAFWADFYTPDFSVSLVPAEMRSHVYGPLHRRLEHRVTNVQLPVEAGAAAVIGFCPAPIHHLIVYHVPVVLPTAFL